MLNPITKHARQRMQQRGIPFEALDVILDFGREIHDHRGCTVVSIDKPARKRIARELGRDRYRKLEKWLGTYVVVGADDAIVTVAHRHGRRLH